MNIEPARKTLLRASAPTVLLVSMATAALAEPLPPPNASITLPSPASNSFDVAVTFGPSDGRMYVWTGGSVMKQNAIDSNSFTSIGTVGSGSSDAGPVAFSRDGSALLMGNGSGGFVPAGNEGLLFSIPSSGGSTSTSVAYVPFHYSLLATPAGAPASTYFLNQGESTFTSSSVSIFDATSGGNVPVIANIPGASSSMAIDSSNRLYVGIGFGADRGELRRFSYASLDNAHDTNTPLDWTSGEVFNADDNNSGAGMFFDQRGYLFVGGPNGLTVFDTSGNYVLYENNGFTSVDYDPFSDRFLVRSFGDQQGMYAAADFFVVPEPATAALGLLAAIALGPLVRRARARLR
jgi:hypothetical protein